LDQEKIAQKEEDRTRKEAAQYSNLQVWPNVLFPDLAHPFLHCILISPSRPRPRPSSFFSLFSLISFSLGQAQIFPFPLLFPDRGPVPVSPSSFPLFFFLGLVHLYFPFLRPVPFQLSLFSLSLIGQAQHQAPLLFLALGVDEFLRPAPVFLSFPSHPGPGPTEPFANPFISLFSSPLLFLHFFPYMGWPSARSAFFFPDQPPISSSSLPPQASSQRHENRATNWVVPWPLISQPLHPLSPHHLLSYYVHLQDHSSCSSFSLFGSHKLRNSNPDQSHETGLFAFVYLHHLSIKSGIHYSFVGSHDCH